MNFLIVGLGGFLGAIARYLVYLGEESLGLRAFPWGTLVINVVGCFISGLLLSLVERSLLVHRQIILLASMGMIGSFTTFSTFSVESFLLLRSNQSFLALGNIVANIVFGIGAVCLGRLVFLRV